MEDHHRFANRRINFIDICDTMNVFRISNGILRQSIVLSASSLSIDNRQYPRQDVFLDIRLGPDNRFQRFTTSIAEGTIDIVTLISRIVF